MKFIIFLIFLGKKKLKGFNNLTKIEMILKFTDFVNEIDKTDLKNLSAKGLL